MGQTSNSTKIRGQSIRLNKLQISHNDFPIRLNRNDAKVACINFGKEITENKTTYIDYSKF